jgi:hypothetical protein
LLHYLSFCFALPFGFLMHRPLMSSALSLHKLPQLHDMSCIFMSCLDHLFCTTFCWTTEIMTCLPKRNMPHHMLWQMY